MGIKIREWFGVQSRTVRGGRWGDGRPALEIVAISSTGSEIVRNQVVHNVFLKLNNDESLHTNLESVCDFRTIARLIGRSFGQRLHSEHADDPQAWREFVESLLNKSQRKADRLARKNTPSEPLSWRQRRRRVRRRLRNLVRQLATYCNRRSFI